MRSHSSAFSVYPILLAVIFVVDAADQGRFEEAQAELERAVEQAHLQNKPLLVFANKQGKGLRHCSVQVQES
jgi:hypothetical protein